MSRSMSFIVTKGFTVVELLIVIVVIAILASISVVSYNGVQSRAKDVSILSGVDQVEDALKIWASKNGSTVPGGYNSTIAVSNGKCSNGSSGWFVGESLAYVCSVEDALVSSKLLPVGFSRSLPKNPHYYASSVPDGRYSLMFYPCNAAGKYILMWTTYSTSASDATTFSGALTQCGYSGPALANALAEYTGYGMRTGRVIEL